MKDNMNYSKYKKGYTLLFSMIVASVVLSIAAFILTVSRKQFILSSSARDSTIALYAADGGIECAIGSNKIGNLGTTTTPSPWLNCNGANLTTSYTSVPDAGNAFGFIDTGNPSEQYYKSSSMTITFTNSCAVIVVYKGYNTTGPLTIIDSRGYNVITSGPCVGTAAVNDREVERAVVLQYFE